jgi:DNA-binding IclR family transcriptional regulator
VARAAVLARVASAREGGFSVARNVSLGVTAISVPVRDANGVIAALTVSGPLTRFTEELAVQSLESAREAAAELGRLA